MPETSRGIEASLPIFEHVLIWPRQWILPQASPSGFLEPDGSSGWFVSDGCRKSLYVAIQGIFKRILGLMNLVLISDGILSRSLSSKIQISDYIPSQIPSVLPLSSFSLSDRKPFFHLEDNTEDSRSLPLSRCFRIKTTGIIPAIKDGLFIDTPGSMGSGTSRRSTHV